MVALETQILTKADCIAQSPLTGVNNKEKQQQKQQQHRLSRLCLTDNACPRDGVQKDEVLPHGYL